MTAASVDNYVEAFLVVLSHHFLYTHCTHVCKASGPVAECFMTLNGMAHELLRSFAAASASKDAHEPTGLIKTTLHLPAVSLKKLGGSWVCMGLQQIWLQCCCYPAH